VICGSYGDGTAVDYQAGMEALLTTILPFSLTDVDEVWCYPGILAGFAGGSFHKAILDEEMMQYSNRMLQGVNMTIDPNLPGLLADAMQAGSFLLIGSMDTYRRDNYLTKIFNKWGIAQAGNAEKTDLAYKIQQVLEKRIAAYQLLQRSAARKKLLQPHLPSQCQYG
jgi:trimethylamine---corrinoid protein Co-methyltransferase